MFHLMRIVCALLLSALVGACATAPSSPWGTMGMVNRHADSETFTVYGPPQAGSNEMSAVTYLVPQSCRGKELTLTAEFRTPQGISRSQTTFHGVHFDYEMRRQGITQWPYDYLEDPSTEWRTVKRTWLIPSDADHVIVRAGIQGVRGALEVRRLRITGC